MSMIQLAGLLRGRPRVLEPTRRPRADHGWRPHDAQLL